MINFGNLLNKFEGPIESRSQIRGDKCLGIAKSVG